MSFRLVGCVAAILLFGITAVPLAAAQPLVELSVSDRDGAGWLSQYAHRGDTWVAGIPGNRYAVRLTNKTGERVLVVLSVDGVNAVTGETANPDQSGYVLDPWESVEINGWRKSMSEVAQFVFSASQNSYASQTGRPANVGVIGVAAFRERQAYRPSVTPRPRISNADAEMTASTAAPSPIEGRRDASAFATESAKSRQQIGTGHGQREWAPVSNTVFVRATRQPGQVSQIRYDSMPRLVALGVVPPQPTYARPRPPQAFPSSFVPDPPRRR